MADTLPVNRVGPFNQLPYARWKITEHPGALPGCCFMCGADSAGREWFVDTGMQFEFHGAVYICDECLTEMATTAGWLTPKSARAISDQMKVLLQENFHLRTQIAALSELEAAVDSFVSARSGYADTGRVGGVPVELRLLEADGEFEGTVDRGEDGTPETGEPVGAGEGETPEPGDGEGVDDLRSDESSPTEFRIKF